MEKINIFYAHSNNKDEPKNTYDIILRKYEDNNEINIYDVEYNDKNNSSFLLQKIINYINDADIFIADITIEDKTKENKFFQNSNVLFELGCALQKFGTNDIILLKHNDPNFDNIIDKSNDFQIPSLLKGLEITYYEYNNDYKREKEYTKEEIDNFCCPFIINKIDNTIKNIKKNKEKNIDLNNYIIFNYSIPIKIWISILQMLNFKCKDYKIYYNLNYAYILFLNKKYDNNEFDPIKNKKNIKNSINIIDKKLYLSENKSICLSYNNDLYEELKHLEILIKIEMLKLKL